VDMGPALGGTIFGPGRVRGTGGRGHSIRCRRRFGRLERLVTLDGDMDESGRELARLDNRARAGEEAARSQRRVQLATGNQV
jgi:hypothetical protein